MNAQSVAEYLDRHHVQYVRISHAPVFTAQEVAASVHMHGMEMAKTVVVWLDGKLALAVVPAPCQVDMRALARVAGAKRVFLATEEEFRNHFPGCEVGAMPPFGVLYDLKVYISPRLAVHSEIALNAGTHTDVIRMAYCDFERLAKPVMAEITIPILVHRHAA